VIEYDRPRKSCRQNLYVVHGFSLIPEAVDRLILLHTSNRSRGQLPLTDDSTAIGKRLWR
jgi:hypothetical protein